MALAMDQTSSCQENYAVNVLANGIAGITLVSFLLHGSIAENIPVPSTDRGWLIQCYLKIKKHHSDGAFWIVPFAATGVDGPSSSQEIAVS